LFILRKYETGEERIKSPLFGLGHDWHKKVNIVKEFSKSHEQSFIVKAKKVTIEVISHRELWNVTATNPYPSVIFLKCSPYGVW
jgi:hypothetical protein